ncbi:MAG TPA: cobyrinate a,c-diamide synthase [Acidimicrobiales bacterium]|nr:cobyrinate a,c-diamide synthase [Acidimicrobiales bacterium]
MAGTHSGVGKTTVATGLMAALADRGYRVAAAKVGPDFIDPGYHAVATARPGRNLDAWICGPEAMAPLAARAAEGAEVLVIEGVMGLFDGAGPAGDGPPAPPGLERASTAELAALLGAPVVLVVDAAAQSASVAPLVHGFATWHPEVQVAAVVLNRVGGDGHEALLRSALAPLGIPVLGALRRDDALAWRDRHLGLVPVVEHRGEVTASVRSLGRAVAAQVDLDALIALAGTAARRRTAHLPPARRTGAARVAVAGGAAFSFAYPDNLERLEEAGATLVPFDPILDPALPRGVDALYAGGGFPEVFLDALAANRALLGDVRTRVAAGLPTWAECGGLLWLARSLDGRPLAGVIPADARMGAGLTLGYRAARAMVDSPVAPAGTRLAGHEFHHSSLDPPGEALWLTGARGAGAGGHASPTLLASYLHLHLGADPAPAERFVATAASRQGR